MRGGVRRLSGIVEPRRVERGGGDEGSVAFGGGDGAANPLRAASCNQAVTGCCLSGLPFDFACA